MMPSTSILSFLYPSLRGSRMVMRLHEATSKNNPVKRIQLAVNKPLLRRVELGIQPNSSRLPRPLLIASHERAPRNDGRAGKPRPYQWSFASTFTLLLQFSNTILSLPATPSYIIPSEQKKLALGVCFVNSKAKLSRNAYFVVN